jgi:hypothetical protein
MWLRMTSDEIFDAISHHLRIAILKELAKKPTRFADLKRKLKIDSSGLLDFHLKKMESIITTNRDGLYILNERGYAAPKAVRVISKQGWQRRALIVNMGFFVVMTAWALAMTAAGLSIIYFVILFSLTTIWMIFYTYWTFIKRRVRLRKNNASHISEA